MTTGTVKRISFHHLQRIRSIITLSKMRKKKSFVAANTTLVRMKCYKKVASILAICFLS